MFDFSGPVTIVVDGDFAELLAALNSNSEKLDRVLEELEMAKQRSAEVQAGIDELTEQINVETDRLAAVLESIAGQLREGMTADEVAASKAKLQGAVDRLKVLGTSTEEPIPPVES